MKSRRGAALLLVIAIVGLLSLLVAEFQRKAHLEAVSAANNALLLQAQALARSGVAAAMALLNQAAGEGQTDDRTGMWYFGEGEESAQAVPVGEYAVSLLIEDQYGKFPLGALLDPNGKSIPARVDAYRRLLESLDLEGADTEALVWALVDWIDNDSEGDRYEYNQRFTVPNAPVVHLDEISRIEVYRDLRPEHLRRILARLDTRSDPTVNVNTASEPVLLALHPDLSAEDAKTLREKLADTPDTNGTVITPYIPVTGRAFPVAFQSKRFRVIARGDAGGVVREADCLVERDRGKKKCRVLDWIQF